MPLNKLQYPDWLIAALTDARNLSLPNTTDIVWKSCLVISHGKLTDTGKASYHDIITQNTKTGSIVHAALIIADSRFNLEDVNKQLIARGWLTRKADGTINIETEGTKVLQQLNDVVPR